MRNKNKLKIKGRYLYFCEYNPFIFERFKIRKVRIRMATLTSSDTLLIVGDDFREEIPAQNANDDEFSIHLSMDYNKEKIIATSKQDIARFIRKMYISSQVEEFITHRFSMGNYLYKNFLNKLKRL
jgi:hypothetical protein